MILSDIDDDTGHEVGDEQMPGTRAALGIAVESTVMAGAVPAAIDGRGVQAGAAGDLRFGAVVTHTVMRTEPAFPEDRIFRDGSIGITSRRRC